MGIRALHSVLRQEVAVAADGVETFDLAVNPLSMIFIAIRPLLDNAGTAINGLADYMTLCEAFNRVNVLWRGASVVSARGEDLAALNYWRRGIMPVQANLDDTDNERVCAVLPIIFGKFPYDPSSCLPKTNRGELTIELDIDVASTGYDGFRYSVEGVELIGASPKEFERVTSVNRTFAATGINDVDLPNGSLVRGILGFGTTAFGGAAPAPTLGRMRLLKDNEEYFYSATDFEVARTIGQMMGRQPPAFDRHTHRVDASAASAVQQSGRPIGVGGSVAGTTFWDNYVFLDLDPSRDDALSVDTSGSNMFQLRVDAETADAARFLTIERVSL